MTLGMLEPHLEEPYKAWVGDPGPDAAATMLDALAPAMHGAIRTHVGEPNPLLIGRARKLTLEALRAYDPQKGKLQTHLYNHLQGLKRAARRQSQVLKVPERISLERQHVDGAAQELAHTLGREPTDAELCDHTGLSTKRIARIRTYRPAVAEGTLEDAETGAGYGGAAGPRGHSPWAEIVYGDLDPHHQKVMEHALGLHGRPVLPNREIAAKLGRSPGAISQAKARIQAKLDEGVDLSPF